jgi:RNA polymerase sigma-70 factor, ECF subfamily
LEQNERQKAFTAHIQQHQALIFKVCHLYCNNEEDKRDLFQEIVFQLWKSYPSFRGEAKFTTWLYRIALNTAITAIRKNKLNHLTAYVDDWPWQFTEGDRAQEIREQAELLNKAIAHLSDIEKSIVMLYLEERSYQEMEEILGINQNSLRVKMNRIKEKLKTKVWT